MCIRDSFCHETSLAEAKAKVAAWMERSRPKRIRNADKQKDAEAEVAPVIAAQQAEPQSLEQMCIRDSVLYYARDYFKEL